MAALRGVAEAPEEFGVYGKAVDPRHEFWACLALKHTAGIGPRTWKRLLEAFGGAWQAVSQLHLWTARRLASDRVVAEFRNAGWHAQAEDEWRQAAQGGHQVLLWTHSKYPQLLRDIPDPPLYLYFWGDVSLISGVCVGIVGARRCSEYGSAMAARLAQGLARSGVTVVSGMAYGIDRAAHLAALREVGSSIAVLGAGLDAGYPMGNADVRALLEERGLVLSELAPRAKPEPHQFPLRNRIISGVSQAVVVVEAGERSGGLITAARALEQNREVMAVPGQANWPSYAGCLRLINDGARAVTCAEDVLREIAPHLRPAHPHGDIAPKTGMHSATSRPDTPRPSTPRRRDASPRDPSPQAAPASQPVSPAQPALELDDDEQKVLEALPCQGAQHIDTVCQSLGWDVGRVSRALVGLELAGAARQLPGMRYERAGRVG